MPASAAPSAVSPPDDGAPRCITTELLLRGVEGDGAPADAGAALAALRHAEGMRLSYSNLLSLDGLDTCRRLQRLRLDNNQLTHIGEGLSQLTQLRWLDLSFNRLRAVEGLGCLRQLTDLSLFHNEIERLDGGGGGGECRSSDGGGLAGLDQLQFLSLGHNAVADLAQLAHLRCLPALEALVLEGNPAKAATPQYRTHCLALLPGLLYLDNALVMDECRTVARERGIPPEYAALVALASVRAQPGAPAAAAARSAHEAVALEEAQVSIGGLARDMMLASDSEFKRLSGIPGAAEPEAALWGALDVAAADFGAAALDKSKQLAHEEVVYQRAAAEAAALYSVATSAAVSSWEVRYQHVACDVGIAAEALASGSAAAAAGAAASAAGALLDAPRQQQARAARLHELIQQAQALQDAAVRDELRLHGALVEMVGAFETVLLEALAGKLALHEAFFRAALGHLADWGTRLTALGDKFLALVKEGGGGVQLENEELLLTVAQDRDALLAAIGACRDARASRAFKTETEMRLVDEQRCRSAVAREQASERSRHRACLRELAEWGSSVRARARAVLAELDCLGGGADIAAAAAASGAAPAEGLVEA